ncbi:DNA cytosine methyltransferase [Brevibacillus borstelensis]|uniref:DNA cytosine methyltransferase n=1 Tax=Brevibacillus borstelensis TaxID=45462 RepID=UPI0030CC44E9
MNPTHCQALPPVSYIERSEYMTFDVTPQLPSNDITVAELFAGGGLMAVGLRAAGYNLVWANDFDKNAVKAYRHNLGDHIVHGDITAIDPADIPDTDVIAGGPPCQDYSVAGTGAGENGERGKLVWAYLRIIEAKRPKAFIFENVKGLITKKHRPTFDALLAKFEEIGYRVSWRLINAWDYGVAQKRERVFIVGIRADLGFAFEFPEPRPEDYRTQVLRDVIGDLPEPSDTCGKNVKKVERVADMNEPGPTVTTQFRCQTVEITNHTGGVPAKEYPGHTASALDEPAKAIVAGVHGVPGGANCFYPPNHVQTRATTVKPRQRLSNQRGYVADMDGPGRTVNTCRLDHAEIHPQAPRRFTVRECLRIQSVPDWYVLPDDLSLSAQYRIVGNGVASRVAYLLGIALAEQLRSSVIGERLRTEVSA